MRNINDLLVNELKRSSTLRKEHISEAFKAMTEGDTRTGLLMLRNIVNATCGFPELAGHLEVNPKSLMRMLSASGNPNANYIFKVIGFLLNQENAAFSLKKKVA